MNQNITTSQEINPKEIPFKSWLSIAWSFAWRSLIVACVATIPGMIVGGIIGFLGAMAKIPETPVLIVAMLVGFGIGILSLIFLLK